MGIYTKKTFTNKLEQRLRTQNRKVTIDGNIIFIFPYFEGHYSTVDKIVYYVNDNKSDKRYIKDLKSISFVNNKVQIIFDDDSIGNLYYKNKKGDLICAEQDNLGIGKVSIDHTPSIYIVLYMMYISENPDFDLLVDFSKELIASTTEIINTAFMKKTRTFNKLVDDVLQNNPRFTTDIPRIYKEIFDKINLELTIDNTANLSFDSLEYYRTKMNEILLVDEEIKNQVNTQNNTGTIQIQNKSKAETKLLKWMNDKNCPVHKIIEIFLKLEKQSQNKEVLLKDIIRAYPEGKVKIPSLKTENGNSYGKVFENGLSKGCIKLVPEIDAIIDRNGW